MKADPLTWAQRTRLLAIETLAYWLGRVNTSDLTERFQVTRSIAQRDIKQYISIAPGNLSYSPQEKAYLVTSIFQRQLTAGSINEYLSLERQSNPSLLDNQVTTVQTPGFNLDPVIIRPVLRAIQTEGGVRVRYRSLSHPEGILRVLYPHQLVNTGFRWHVRAYCETRQDFRDFNLSRIVSSEFYSQAIQSCAKSALDKKWNKFVKLIIKPNPSLPENEVALLEQEYSMKRGVLNVTTRGALVPYLLQSFQIDPNVDRNHNPRQFRLILSNLDEISDYLF